MELQIFSMSAAHSQFQVRARIGRPYIWISIVDPDVQEFEPAKLGWHRGTLQVMFHDISSVEQNTAAARAGYLAPTEEDAKRIVRFIQKYRDHVEIVAVHCHAGISRSSATAAAISLWLNKHDSGIFADQKYRPNKLLFNLLKKEIEDLGEWPKEVVETFPDLSKITPEEEDAMVSRGEYSTCDKCEIKGSCEFSGDPYNTDGDCLRDK
jgi:predicted protein tyrosine phosphatase